MARLISEDDNGSVRFMVLEERVAELQNENDLLHRQNALLRASEAAFQQEAKVVSMHCWHQSLLLHRALPGQQTPEMTAGLTACSRTAMPPCMWHAVSLYQALSPDALQPPITTRRAAPALHSCATMPYQCIILIALRPPTALPLPCAAA